ncbi:MAG: 3-hydroxyacyl-CoA dehydrogenase NAD-binding domain-containing protein [Actinomycetota bacterium]|nr:3-hydroxyacyl-CoA dehydrogenase NAD-binding domain-containing protein [Actinomycetota bacterium]MDH5277681.1 3-hydroxyacyl-CoA dehydrogenase NAD-binding domain-containing protein [Actinomycetota bacterium]
MSTPSSTLPPFPDEVVTHAHARDVRLPGGAGTAVLITLDNGHDHTKPNTFGPASLASLEAALETASARADAGEIVAVALTGKPFFFSAGADLKAFRALRGHEDLVEIARLGHRVFRRLGEMSVPSFALVNGLALGGGLEAALHCTYRAVSTSAPALALPEVFLGLIPGWGGTYLLPRLIGPDRAVTVIIDNPTSFNKMLKPKDALELGVADVAFEPADFLEESLRWVSQVVAGQVVVPRLEHVDPAAWEAALERGRSIADAKTHGVPPAPYRALDLLRLAQTADRDTAFAAEDEALADMGVSPELASSMYAFDLVQKRAKRPVGVPDKDLARPVTKVGVVGAGLMAGQLALLFARRLQVPVHMIDLDEARVERGLAYVRGEIDKLAAKRRVSPDGANRLRGLVTGGTDKRAFADADFVIEAVFEDLAVKQQVFGELEEIVSDTCILATNTSSLSVTAMGDKLEHPERVVGFHFFNPVAVMQLLEIVRGDATDDATLASAFAVAKQLRKSAVLVKDAPAFVVNRLLTRFLGEVTAAVDEGTPLEVADRALAPLGLPMSPFVLLQLVGPAVALHVAETMHAAFPDRFGVSDNLARVVDAGKSAIYTWDSGDQQVDPEVLALFQLGDHPSTAEEVRTRALSALAQEIHLMLDEGVVAEPQDVDLCLLLGAGWPFWVGGITPYLDRSGIAAEVNGRPFHPHGLVATH